MPKKPKGIPGFEQLLRPFAAAKWIHCWADGPSDKDGMRTTCMLPDGHKGPHEWTRYDKLVVHYGDTKKVTAKSKRGSDG